MFEIDGEVTGCFRCALDFEHKKGYSGGFMVKKKYQQVLDVTKSIIGSYVWMWKTFKKGILMWYCENRTAHAASQYITSVCGIKTVAFFPNKDVFYDQVESDVMGVIYREKTLKKYRDRKTPVLIENALDSFLHCDNLYDLGNFQLQKAFRKDLITDKYGYGYHQFFIRGTKSYFTFLHTSQIQNFEKTKYHVESLEELYVFLEEFLKSMKERAIRYSEVFVSAFAPEHQQVFYEFGFRARGYVPCWNYNKTENKFEDYVVFNCFEGEVSRAELLPKGQKLVDMLSVQIRPI